MSSTTRRGAMLAALATVAASPARALAAAAVPMPHIDYIVMAARGVAWDFENGWRYPVDRETILRIAAGLESLGVVDEDWLDDPDDLP